MDTQIKAVIFDLGRVLLDFDYNIAAKRLAKFASVEQEAILRFFLGNALISTFEEGNILPEDFFLRAKQALGLSLEYIDFAPIWNEIFFQTNQNKSVYTLARQLKERYRTMLLSNINVLHLDYIKKEFPIFDAFHEVVASCEVGIVKPNALIYQKALEILSLSAQNVFYTDDRQELIDSASALGIHSFVYKGSEQLKKDLASAGVRVD